MFTSRLHCGASIAHVFEEEAINEQMIYYSTLNS